MIAAILRISGKAGANFLRFPETSAAEGPARSTPRLARAYAIWWLLSLVAFTTIVSLREAHKAVPSLVDICVGVCPGALADKLAYYSDHKSEFNVILLGDSLTYTGLHPEFIDPELGTRSVNMAMFAHWFATQYPFIQDLIPEIPRGTRVLWSVHLYDFVDAASVERVYPVGTANAVRYWSWGARFPGLADNILYYNPLTSFFVRTGELRERVMQRGANPVALPGIAARAFARPTASAQADSGELRHAGSMNDSPATQADFPTAPEFIRLQNHTLPESEALKTRLTQFYSHFPSVAAVSTVSDHGQINSAILYLTHGGYYRIELVPEYFREKQQEMAKSVWRLGDKAAENYTPPPLGPVSLKMFEAGLEAFRKAGVPVIVNAMEEAPFTFPNEIVRRKFRRLVDQTLRPIAQRYGDGYVHVDYASVIDSDYFDYNHFNSNGVGKYTALLVDELGQLPEFARRSGN